MENLEGASLLLVDDDAIFRERMGRALQKRGLEVREAWDHPSAMALAQEDPPELAVVDLRMPGPGGLELVRDLRALEPTIQILVLTGYGSIASALNAVRLGATNYLVKPADAEQVLMAFHPSSPDVDPGLTTPTLARVEWEHIERVLADCGGNISMAARVLGLHRRSLQRKLSKYPSPR